MEDRNIVNTIVSEMYKSKEHNPYMEAADKLYYQSGIWCCDDSPTKAHYWRPIFYRSEVWKCKWCGKYRMFPISQYDIDKAQNRNMYKKVFTQAEVDSAVDILNQGGK